MSHHFHRLPFVIALFVLAPPLWAHAVPFDVRGNWQVNLNCDLNATASGFLLLDEDTATGATTGRITDCGTFEVPMAIRRPLSCVTTPSLLVGQVNGIDFELPATAFYASDAAIPPFPFLTCSTATHLLSAHHLTGTVTADDTGRAIRIDGMFLNERVEFHDTTGAICWSLTNAPSCSLAMRRNDLVIGDNVAVSPRDKTTVTFEHVISPGTVKVEPLTEATGTVPENFEVLGTGGVPIFYDVSTTATFTGTVTSCFPYPDANGDGIVDGTNPPLDETALRVLHEEGGVFVDRTLSLDTTAKIICGQTTSLSQLTIAHPPAAPRRDYSLGGKLILTQRLSGREIGHFGATFVAPALPTAANPDDPREGGTILELFSTDQTVTQLLMPAEGWAASHHGRVFRFLNPLAPNGLSPVALAVLKLHPIHVLGNPPLYWRGHLSVESRAVGVALDSPPPALGVRVTLGSLRYCDIFKTFQPGTTNKLIATAYGSPPLDCADKRMWWTLNRVQ
jgi:hypothetical protein